MGAATVPMQIPTFGIFEHPYCAGAWEDKNNDCEILNTESCFHNFGSYTHDAICQCKSEGLFTFKNLSSQEVTITF